MFGVGSASEEYPLTIGGFTGITPTDPFSTYFHLDGMKFSTYDNDNDSWRTGNCVMKVGNATGGGITNVGTSISTLSTILLNMD